MVNRHLIDDITKVQHENLKLLRTNEKEGTLLNEFVELDGSRCRKPKKLVQELTQFGLIEEEEDEGVMRYYLSPEGYELLDYFEAPPKITADALDFGANPVTNLLGKLQHMKKMQLFIVVLIVLGIVYSIMKEREKNSNNQTEMLIDNK